MSATLTRVPLCTLDDLSPGLGRPFRVGDKLIAVFRTRGGNSVATVRGTAWYVEDRCDGTLTRVSKGSVSVYDRGRHRTVVVRAGHSYLAHSIR